MEHQVEDWWQHLMLTHIIHCLCACWKKIYRWGWQCEAWCTQCWLMTCSESLCCHFVKLLVILSGSCGNGGDHSLQLLSLGTFEDVYYEGSCLCWNLKSISIVSEEELGVVCFFWVPSNFLSLQAWQCDIQYQIMLLAVTKASKICICTVLYSHYCKKWNPQEVTRCVVQEGLIWVF